MRLLPPAVALLAVAVPALLAAGRARAAKPPPHVFVNIASARMVDARTLELTFEHPRCADPKVLAAQPMGWAVLDEKAAEVPPRYGVRLGVRELRRRPGEAACTGPVEKQTLRVDLRQLLDVSIVRGELTLNDESLYGHMKKLPELRVQFDLRE